MYICYYYMYMCYYYMYMCYYYMYMCNGLAHLQQWPCYLQVPGFKSHLRSVEFFTSKKVSLLTNLTPMLTSVPCAPINQLKAVRGTCKTLKLKEICIFLFSLRNVSCIQCAVITIKITFKKAINKIKPYTALHKNLLYTAKQKPNHVIVRLP